MLHLLEVLRCLASNLEQNVGQSMLLHKMSGLPSNNVSFHVGRGETAEHLHLLKSN